MGYKEGNFTIAFAKNIENEDTRDLMKLIAQKNSLSLGAMMMRAALIYIDTNKNQGDVYGALDAFKAIYNREYKLPVTRTDASDS